MSVAASQRLWLAPVAALSAWVLYFVAAYALHSIGCVRGWTSPRVLGVDALTFALAALTVVTVAVIAVAGWWGYRTRRVADGAADAQRAQFAAALALMVAGLAIVSTVWVGLPMMFSPPCH